MAAGRGDGEPDRMAERPVALTRAEHDAYRRQLAELRRRQDEDLPRLLREARTFVSSDASEEIAQIHEDFAYVQRRIAALEDLLRAAVVPDDQGPDDVVGLASVVAVEYVGSGRSATFAIGGVGDGAPGSVSASSPVGAALLGRRPGEVVTVELPRGRVEELRVLEVASDRQQQAA